MSCPQNCVISQLGRVPLSHLQVPWKKSDWSSVCQIWFIQLVGVDTHRMNMSPTCSEKGDVG